MKLFSLSQVREADAYTIKHEPVSSIHLMERAALACTQWITERYDHHTEFRIICGSGNNGGDGLAVARLLTEQNYNIEVFLIRHTSDSSQDFSTNLERLRAEPATNGRIHTCDSFRDFQRPFNCSNQTVIIDALFGSGLNKPVEGFSAQVIQTINRCGAPVIAIDVPSGLYCDQLNESSDEIINATSTLTFQFPKLSFMFPETAAVIGEFNILDIGIHPQYIDHTFSSTHFITKKDAAQLLKKRSRIAHKGNFGHSLLIAGSHGKMGSAVLAAKACLKSGTGLLTMHIPGCGYVIMQTSVPEAMASTDAEPHFITDHIRPDNYTAIGIGPGIGTEKQTQNVLKLLIQNSNVPLVLDADALNILAENKTWYSFLPANSILTPHPKEFERLTTKAANSSERLALQKEFSIKHKVYVVLKGAHTSISCPDGTIFFNSTGNPGMAKGGSGDSLTGIITAFMAQLYSPEQSCILGVYLHGLAGDFAAHHHSEESMTASDLIDHLGDAFNFLRA
jgi:NAD(P)H-hydrate epimerase